MNLSQRKILIIAGGIVIFLILGFLIFLNLRPGKGVAVKLSVWGFESKDAFDPIIKSYKQQRPNVEVTYQQIPAENYESGLLNALAAGRGPDIFPLHNRALPKEKDKLAPVISTQFTLSQFEGLFPTIAEQDFTFSTSSALADKKIYALPLSIDTLALLYNKDLFDQAAIVRPPNTWDEFQTIIPRLRSISQTSQIQKAAAAIGGSKKTIGTAVDLLNVLMLQNGTRMTTPDLREASFASGSNNSGLQAFNFYLQFANPGSNYYTWNDNQPDSLESFSNGNTAMLFGYYSDFVRIKKKNPFLNIGVASLPQPAGASAVNYADYWGLAVSKQSRASGWAWDFIIFLASQPEVSKLYLGAANRPPALRSLISGNINDPILGVFSRQALTARSWYEADEEKINGIFNAAIAAVLNGQFDSGKALLQAQDQISQLMTNF